MQSLKRIFFPALAVLGSGVTFATPASAQLFGPGPSSESSVAYVGAGNLSNDGSGNVAIWPTVEQYSPTGQAVIATGSQSFSGMDSGGNTQTMTLSGTGQAMANFDVFHASASGTVVNPYYNASNPTYFAGFSNNGVVNNAGSPQYLQVLGQTLFQDTLTLNPTVDPIVGIRYVFHIEGNVIDDQHSYAYLAFSVGANSTVFFTSPGMSTADWATPDWSVTPGAPIPIGGNFGAVFQVNTNNPNTPEGQTVNGTADFYNTLDVSSIQLLDANGNQVNGATYLSASGTHYNVLGATYGAAAAPEPGSVTLLVGLGLSGAACLRRRRRSRI